MPKFQGDVPFVEAGGLTGAYEAALARQVSSEASSWW
jgi:hypothetical protein